MWLDGMVFSILLSILSGILLTVGFPKFDLYYLSWVALIPLFVAVRDKTGRQAFTLGYLCGFVHFASALYWIRFVVDHYGGLPFVVAVLILLLLCAYLALYPAFFALLARKWQNDYVLWLIGLPCAWVTLEFIRAYAVSGFPWANLGYTQTPFTSVIQCADLVGVFGVSWLVVLGNTAIAACLYRIRAGASLVVFGVCLAAAAGYGVLRLDTIRNLQEQAPPFTVGVVQGNIDQSRKWDPEFQQETLRRYKLLSMEASVSVPQPQLLVWPETAAPFLYGLDEALTAQLDETIRQAQTAFLFGAPGAAKIDGRVRFMNRAYLVDGNGVLEGAYTKQHLVPFGEYVPFSQVLFFVHRLVEAAGDFSAGKDPSPLMVGDTPVGVLICYEGIFPDLSRATVLRGATTLINLTNDAWYGNTSAPYQHVEMARWRAIEFRVPMVRAANTGISAIFDATGTPCGTVSLNREGYLVCTVHPFRLVTFYARSGNLFAWICALIAAAGVLYSTQKRRMAF